MIHILIVEDEKPISNLIRLSLKKAGYDCTCAFDGAEAADILEERRFDLILLDVMLPEIDGFSLMEYIRPMEIPVIFLTAKNAVNDRVKGLELGAEDYLVKPYEIIELLAWVNVVLRRYNKTAAELRVGGLVIDTQAMLVSRDGETISLTPKEYELLLLFARNPGIALYRETIYERVWKEDFPYLAMIILVSFGYFFRGLLAFAVSLLTTKKAVVIFVPIWYFTNHFGFVVRQHGVEIS